MTTRKGMRFSQEAGKEESPVTSPEGNDGLASPAEQEQIASKAYSLWEEAGKPEGNSMTFWLQAEQSIKGTGETMRSLPKAH